MGDWGHSPQLKPGAKSLVRNKRRSPLKLTKFSKLGGKAECKNYYSYETLQTVYFHAFNGLRELNETC
jgi:hypothetical protein